MNLTSRLQENHIMSYEEKREYVRVIRAFPWLYRPLLQELALSIQGASTILDIGCGDGYLLSLIHDQFPDLELSGIDPDPFFITEATHQYPFLFKQGNAEEFDWKADIIISNLALHHFRKPLQALQTMVNRAHALVLCSDHVRPRTEEELVERLARRKTFVGEADIPYYHEHARDSIGEAYSRLELEHMVRQLRIPASMQWFDDDYFERVVITIPRSFQASTESFTK